MLGSDLNINGDVGEAGVDGPAGTEPLSSAEPQTSPPEGNSMLGKNHFSSHTSLHLLASGSFQNVNIKTKFTQNNDPLFV